MQNRCASARWTLGFEVPGLTSARNRGWWHALLCRCCCKRIHGNKQEQYGYGFYGYGNMDTDICRYSLAPRRQCVCAVMSLSSEYYIISLIICSFLSIQSFILLELFIYLHCHWYSLYRRTDLEQNPVNHFPPPSTSQPEIATVPNIILLFETSWDRMRKLELHRPRSAFLFFYKAQHALWLSRDLQFGPSYSCLVQRIQQNMYSIQLSENIRDKEIHVYATSKHNLLYSCKIIGHFLLARY